MGDNPNNDVLVTSPPTDGVSSITWSPKANIFVATSWDNQARCWEWNGSMATPKISISHQQPVLCSGWSKDGMRVFTGGCDNVGKLWTLQTGQAVDVAKHDAPIKTIFFIDELQMLCTGSWDGSLRYWDLRQSTPAAVVQMPERVYCMDVLFPLAVVATAERKVLIYNLNNPKVEYKKLDSPLKYQSRSLACFPDKKGFALGSIEGRVAIHHVENADASKNFAFKCHRDGNNVYAVNSISFHPGFGTFSTAGSDGTFHFWDKSSKQRLQKFEKMPQPIPCSSFNMDGSLFAYACSYDWSKGTDNYNPSTAKNNILIHPCKPTEVRPRPRN
jgi:mRNA export factor